ncbi:unnamed protein product [Rotaria sordida]|uniref:Uncharacterized protein n=1 Tax=Rotaria sordida TaxID=392033 RepID=A0A819DPW8_9BILA|nr:unnamed protein product [Rotaria sordida]
MYCLQHLQQIYSLIVQAFLSPDQMSANVFLAQIPIVDNMINEVMIPIQMRLLEVKVEPTRLFQWITNRKGKRPINRTLEEQVHFVRALMLHISSMTLMVKQTPFNNNHVYWRQDIESSLNQLNSNQSIVISYLTSATIISEDDFDVSLNNFQSSIQSFRLAYQRIRIRRIEDALQSRTPINSDDQLPHGFFLFQLNAIAQLLLDITGTTTKEKPTKEKKKRRSCKEYFKISWPRLLGAIKTALIIGISSIFVMVPAIAKTFKNGPFILITVCMAIDDTVGGTFTTMKVRLIGIVLETLQTCRQCVESMDNSFKQMYHQNDKNESSTDGDEQIDIEIKSFFDSHQLQFYRLMNTQRILLGYASLEPTFWWFKNDLPTARYALLAQQQDDMFRLLQSIDRALLRINACMNEDRQLIGHLQDQTFGERIFSNLREPLADLTRQLNNCLDWWSSYFTLTQTRCYRAIYECNCSSLTNFNENDFAKHETYFVQLRQTIDYFKEQHQQSLNCMLEYFNSKINEGDSLTTAVPHINNDQLDSIFIATTSMFYSQSQLIHAALALGECEVIRNNQSSEAVLTSLRDECVARCNVDTGIRDNTTNQVDYDFWNGKVQQSQMEISIINLLIDYINGNFPAATTVPTAPTSAAASTGPTTSSTESTTVAASSTAPNSSTTTTSHMINPH